MNTYLGVSSLLASDDVDEAAVADGEVLYMEGYLFDRDDAKEAFRRAAEVAHAARPAWCRSRCPTRSASTATATTSVARARRGRPAVRQRGRAAARSTRLDDARRGDRRACARDCALAAITCGAEGSHRRHRRRGDRTCRPSRCDRVLDTTGAGDLYAAGFLLRPHHAGATLAECGRLGSIAAAEVISHVGPRPLVELRTLLRMTADERSRRARRALARRRARRRHPRRAAGADRRRPGDELARALRRPAAVRHGRAARRGRRRAAADEPARRAPGGGRARRVPARHRPGAPTSVAW